MKKLMTMLAAAAMAFGLYAGDIGFIAGADFESTTEAPEQGTLTWTSSGFTAGWWLGLPDGLEPTAGAKNKDPVNRPAIFKDSDDNMVLALKTTLGNPVVMNISAAEPSKDIPDGGLYFDGYVNMTAFDEDPDLSLYDDDNNPVKIAVYAQESTNAVGEVTGTNFVVVAKAVDSADAFRFICAKSSLPDDLTGWHRLTIKAIADIGTGATGFVVFIDEEAVECEAAQIDATDLNAKAAAWNENGNLFVSLVNEDATVKSIAFDGQGSVDELVFTTTAPEFAEDSEFVVADWSAVKGNTAFGTFTLTVDGEAHEFTEAEQAAGKVNVPYAKDTTKPVLVLSWSGDATHMGGKAALDADGNAKIATGTEPTLAAATFETLKFADLADAVAYANTNETGAGTVTLLLDATKALSFEKENTVLDLDGCTLTQPAGDSPAITVSAALTISGGTVAGNGDPVNANAVSAWAAPVTINDGTFDGPVYGLKTNLIINDGKFAGETAPDATTPNGKKWVKGDDDYWTLQALEQVTFTVVAKANTTVTEVKVNGSVVTESPYAITEGQAYVVTFAADAGYTLDGAATVEGTAGAENFEVTGPDATAIDYTINVTGGTAEPATYNISASQQTVTLTAGEAPDGKKFKQWNLTVKDGVSIDGNVITIAANTTGEITVAAEWEDDAKPAPDKPKTYPSAQEAEAAKNAFNNADDATKATMMAIPEVAGLAEDAAKAQYAGLFEAVQGGADNTEVTFVLSETGKATIEAAIEASEASILAPEEGKATITAQPGLYYGLKTVAAVEDIATAEAAQWTQATTTSVEFEITQPSEAKGFYQVQFSASEVK